MEMTAEQLQRRRQELAADWEAAESTLAASRAALIAGAGRPDAVVKAQSIATALQGALDDLDAQITQARQAEQAAREAQARAEIVSQLKDICSQGESTLKEVLASIAEGEQACADAGRRAIAARKAHRAIRNRFRIAAAQLAPVAGKVPGALSDDDRAQLSRLQNELARAGANFAAGVGVPAGDGAAAFDVHAYQMPPQTAYAGAFHQAVNVAWREGQGEIERAAAQARRNAQRAAQPVLSAA